MVPCSGLTKGYLAVLVLELGAGVVFLGAAVVLVLSAVVLVLGMADGVARMVLPPLAARLAILVLW